MKNFYKILNVSKIIFTLAFVSCSAQMDIQDSIQNPYVIEVNPAYGQNIQELTSVSVRLSSTIREETAHLKSFLIVPKADENLSLLSDDDIRDLIEDGDLISVDGIISWDLKTLTLHFQPTESVEAGSYYVILTSQLQNESYYPLSQSPLNGNTAFVSEFSVGDNGNNQTQTESPQENENLIRPDFLVINEILYDAEGNETDGYQFIELFGTPNTNISGYKIQLVNGADGNVTEEILLKENSVIDSTGLFVIADSKTSNPNESQVIIYHTVDNFDAQNGPDSVFLLDSNHQILDVLGYGEAMVEQNEDDIYLFETTPAPDCPEATSLSRISGNDTNNNLNDFIINQIPSPGEIKEQIDEVEEQTEEETEEETNEPESFENIDNVKITEIVTDPQHDWNDSDGGNQIPFDETFGNGTIGSSDEWLEIYNGRDETVNLSNWFLEINDGTDEVENFKNTTATLQFFADGDVENFYPGEYLIVGNPLGDMKNTTTLRLFEGDELVDEVFVDDANSENEFDEAYQLNEELIWELNKATIGF